MLVFTRLDSLRPLRGFAPILEDADTDCSARPFESKKILSREICRGVQPRRRRAAG